MLCLLCLKMQRAERPRQREARPFYNAAPSKARILLLSFLFDAEEQPQQPADSFGAFYYNNLHVKTLRLIFLSHYIQKAALR